MRLDLEEIWAHFRGQSDNNHSNYGGVGRGLAELERTIHGELTNTMTNDNYHRN